LSICGAFTIAGEASRAFACHSGDALALPRGTDQEGVRHHRRRGEYHVWQMAKSGCEITRSSQHTGMLVPTVQPLPPPPPCQHRAREPKSPRSSSQSSHWRARPLVMHHARHPPTPQAASVCVGRVQNFAPASASARYCHAPAGRWRRFPAGVSNKLALVVAIGPKTGPGPPVPQPRQPRAQRAARLPHRNTGCSRANATRWSGPQNDALEGRLAPPPSSPHPLSHAHAHAHAHAHGPARAPRSMCAALPRPHTHIHRSSATAAQGPRGRHTWHR
jgi:hypothetical protein